MRKFNKTYPINQSTVSRRYSGIRSSLAAVIEQCFAGRLYIFARVFTNLSLNAVTVVFLPEF